MAFLLDTSVAIGLMKDEGRLRQQASKLAGAIFVSVITEVELAGGVWRERHEIELHRTEIETFLSGFKILEFDRASAAAYGDIVLAAGFSRRKIIDRMIAAQGLIHGLTLVTANPRDFADIPRLQVLGL